MKTLSALFISPHLDDVAFSCGGTLIKLALNGWNIINLTCFTKSILNPQGFALACQLDKGLSANVDYMELRRAEDLEFTRRAKVSETVWINFAEAPNRGYESAKDLFDGVHEDDEIWRDLAIELMEIVEESEVDAIFAPQGIGNHVDHLQTIRAVLSCNFQQPIFWYKDAPYAIRKPEARHSDLLPQSLFE
ncbi:MAG: PIG-L family deacetylase, partial [Pyrinomonadaceae bacterium]|nr:PIG-L family deacetylase [Pyrinomonadaceae bacterium]